MAQTNVASKSGLVSTAGSLSSGSTDISSLVNEVNGILNSISNIDNINFSSGVSKLNSDGTAASEDLTTVTTNILNYANKVVELDVNDFDSVSLTGGSGLAAAGDSGTTITLPSGLGSVHTYMGWQCITDKSSTQYKLRSDAGMNFDSEGFAKIGDRYVVATTTTYGNVGDYIDVYQEDGSVIKCVIGDIKNQNDAGCNKWGHDNGKCVVEFVVDKNSWYSNGGGSHVNPGTSGCHPEWNQNITKIVNTGNYWGNPTTVTANDASNVGAAVVTTAATTAAAVSGNYGNYSGSSYRGSNTSSNYSGYSGNTSSNYTSGNTNSNSFSSANITSSNSDGSIYRTRSNRIIDTGKYHNNIWQGFEVTVGNKQYEVSDEDFELLCAIVAAESDKTYDDALAVITTILNRCESSSWIKSHGTNPVKQATAPSQFVVYEHGSYKKYMDGNVPETVKTAVEDALAGLRNHKYLSFRSNGTTSYSSNMITVTGNRYANTMTDQVQV